MKINKNEIVKKICFTDLVYGRINKKLNTDLSREQIEELILKILDETDEKYIFRKGKNYYVVNAEHNTRLTINLKTFRIITVDRIKKDINRNT